MGSGKFWVYPEIKRLLSVTESDYVCLTKSLKLMEATYLDKLFRRFVKLHPEIPQNLKFSDLRCSSMNINGQAA